MSYQDIPAAEVDELLRTEQPIVIDQRDAQSRSKGQLPNAVAASDAVINALMRQRRNNPAVLVYCYHGNQRRDFCRFLGQHQTDVQCSELHFRVVLQAAL